MEKRGGFLITFEGVEGTGKREQARRCQAFLQRKGIDCVILRKFHDTLAGRIIRKSLLDPEDESSGAEKSNILDPRTEIYLLVASIGELYAKRIKYELNAGRTVIVPGYDLAMLSYQAYGDLYGDEDVLAHIKHLTALATEERRPDIMFILDQDAEVAFAYAQARTEQYLFRHKRDLAYYFRAAEGFRISADMNWQKGAVFIQRKSIEEIAGEVQVCLEEAVLPGGEQTEIYARLFAYQKRKGKDGKA